MDLQWRDGDSEVRFCAHVEGLARALGHADGVEPFRSYCTGLLLPGARKSVEPMAARLWPDQTLPEGRHALRKARGKLPRDDQTRRNAKLAGRL